jgi:N-acyl-L-homoserine lactone synthetase
MRAGQSRSAAERERHAAAVDELTRRVLGNLVPLSFELARDPREVDAALRLRYECVIERGWARPEQLPGGRERDEYDEGALHVLCHDGAVLAGCLRIVLPRRDRPLPTERHFGIHIEEPGRVVDAGRLVVRSGYRGAEGHPVLAGLFCRGWLELRRRGFDRAVAAAPPSIVRLFGGVGLVVTVLGQARMYWGERRAPVEVAPAAGRTFSSLDPRDPGSARRQPVQRQSATPGLASMTATSG